MKFLLQFLIAFAILICLPALSFAAGVDNGSMLDFVQSADNITLGAVMLLAVAEVVLRLYPTSRDISLVNIILSLVNTLIPNRALDRSGASGKFSIKSIFQRKDGIIQ